MYVELITVIVGALLGAILAGGAGFAFAVVATAFWVHVLPPPQIVLLAAACATVIHAGSIWQFRKEINYRRLMPFLAGALLGVPIGVLALKYTRPDAFRTAAGIIIIGYTLIAAFRPQQFQVKLSKRSGEISDFAVGWIGGIMGGLITMHGVLPTLWCGIRGWSKSESRSVYQPFIFLTGLYVIALVGLNVQVDLVQTSFNFLASLPALIIGLLIGMRLFSIVSELLFRRAVLGLVFLSGVVMLF